MFKIIEGDFKNNKYSDEEYLDNWPMLYILENGRQAYIGESSHVKTRMTQHSSIEEKRIFDKVHRVLLTRASAGMVICVPVGNANRTLSGFWEDSTRLPEYYDGTYQYLKSLGIEEI